ncbi:MAG: glycine cleavage system protein GcvH [Gemmatimonadota bacterium]|nr:glycine cleavage system protein GcvH [Gemmatimonadota bacterium]
MHIPEKLRYTSEHEWIRLEGDRAVIGITDYAQDQLGDIVFVELPDVGDAVETMGVFGAVEAVKTVSDLFSPLAGEISDVNIKLELHPEYVNEDPYGNGWMIKLKMFNPDQYNGLLNAQGYLDLIGEE